MAKRKSRRRSSWGTFLLFWALLLLLLGSLLCFVLNRYAERYEAWLPEKIMDELMESMSEDDWRRTLGATVGEVSEFEDAHALFDDYFTAALAQSKLAYRKDMADSDNSTQIVYYVYAGTSRLGRVRMARTDTPPYLWAKEWKLDSIEAVPFSEGLQGVMVQIDAPDGETVLVNDIALRQEQITDPAVTLEEISALEQRFSVRQRLVRYEIGPLYGTITVTDGEGSEIAPSGAVSGGLLRYVVKPRETYSLDVEAPAGVTVSVCGAELGEADVTERESNLFRGLEGYLPGGAYETLHYKADGLYTKPEIHASMNGLELSAVMGENGKVYFFYPTDGSVTMDMTAAAQDYYNAYASFTNYKYNTLALKNLRDRILPGTELASYVNNSYDAMIWASATEVNYKELSFDNYHPVSEDCFTCTIRYKADFTAQQWNEQVSYEMEDGYKMVFIRSGGRWLAATMYAFD